MGFFSAITSLVADGIGTGVQAAAQREEGRVKQRIFERNAKQRELDAQTRQIETKAIGIQKRTENRKTLARKKMSFFGRGLQVEGTPLDILAEDAGNLELKALELERQGERDVSGLRQAARFDRFKGKSARRAGKIASQVTILQGVSRIAGNTANFASAGAFKT